MSRPIQETVACPECSAQSAFTIWTSLNVTVDPEQKQALIMGDLFRFTCPTCAATTQFVYPLLYHDAEKRVMIWFVPPDKSGRGEPPPDPGVGAGGARAALEGYTLRAVRSVNELLEKVLTFDAGLDDLAIEMVKLAIATQIPEHEQSDETEIRFASAEHDPSAPPGQQDQLMFAIVTPGGTKGATLPREPIYSNMQRAAAELTARKPPPAPGEWRHVDAEYLMSFMQITDAGDAPAGLEGGAETPPSAPPPPPATQPDADKPWWNRD